MNDTQHKLLLPALPVQFGFKHRMPDGRVLDLLLRRVKEGNETDVELTYDGPRHVSGYGRFSDEATLLERLSDAALVPLKMQWAQQSTRTILHAAREVCRYQPALWQLFCPKGKLEIYTPEARVFETQYIAGNYTMKCHANTLEHSSRELLYVLAQHLDYPFGAGERRFSTSRLFDVCFAAEKVIAPKGLAARIDESLMQRGLYQAHRHTETDYEHVKEVLHDHSAAIRNSYERVLQRERFAALIAHWYGSPIRGVKAPLLDHYRQFIELDLMLQQQNDYKNYPSKTRDDLAEDLHHPLALIFTSQGGHDAASNDNYRKQQRSSDAAGA